MSGLPSFSGTTPLFGLGIRKIVSVLAVCQGYNTVKWKYSTDRAFTQDNKYRNKAELFVKILQEKCSPLY